MTALKISLLMFTLAFAILVFGYAYAGENIRVLEPPRKYIKPIIGEKIVVFEMPISRVRHVCQLASGLNGAVGCAKTFGKGRGLIVIPRKQDVTKRTYRDIRGHEIAHIRGWPGWHPQSQKQTRKRAASGRLF